MKKTKLARRDDLRRSYGREDFSNGLVRGKYSSRVTVESDVVRRNIGREILEGIREIKRGEHGRVTTVPSGTARRRHK